MRPMLEARLQEAPQARDVYHLFDVERIDMSAPIISFEYQTLIDHHREHHTAEDATLAALRKENAEFRQANIELRAEIENMKIMWKETIDNNTALRQKAEDNRIGWDDCYTANEELRALCSELRARIELLEGLMKESEWAAIDFRFGEKYCWKCKKSGSHSKSCELAKALEGK
jgi:hypothetical protein